MYVPYRQVYTQIINNLASQPTNLINISIGISNTGNISGSITVHSGDNILFSSNQAIITATTGSVLINFDIPTLTEPTGQSGEPNNYGIFSIGITGFYSFPVAPSITVLQQTGNMRLTDSYVYNYNMSNGDFDMQTGTYTSPMDMIVQVGMTLSLSASASAISGDLEFYSETDTEPYIKHKFYIPNAGVYYTYGFSIPLKIYQGHQYKFRVLNNSPNGTIGLNTGGKNLISQILSINRIN